MYLRDSSLGAETGKWGRDRGGEREQGSIPALCVSAYRGKRWGKGEDMVYCAKGKQRGHSASAYWHKPRRWLRASLPGVSDGQSRRCLVRWDLVQTDFSWRDVSSSWSWREDRNADPLAGSLALGHRCFKKATIIKIVSSFPRSHLWILQASCCGAQELFLSSMAKWDTSILKLPSMAGVPADSSWLMLFLLRSDRSGFPSRAQSRAQSKSGSAPMCRFGVQAGPVQAGRAEPVLGTGAVDAAHPWCMLCPGNTARECCCSFNCNLGKDLYFYFRKSPQKRPVCPGNLSFPLWTINMLL